MNRKLYRLQGRSGRKEEKIRWPLTENEPQFLGRPDRSIVNTPTVLFWLMHEVKTERAKNTANRNSDNSLRSKEVNHSLSQLRLMVSGRVYHSYG
jgi:hypothetical protein